ncbi:MAG: AsnC family transcriptional regulator [Actinobacteria bacterium]|nr:AsnC family transcriptional regulator [Actinomycetota bacterium]MCL5883601.1 AsnC family transcriptional regulator [Actinomycetota bacterium]
MDDTDKKIVTLIQASFPVTAHPYAEIGAQLGLGEEEVIERIRGIKDSGEIRRMGASFDSRKLGYASTLCAVHVPPEKLENAVEVVNSYLNVTHNYERNHHYNMWFTLIAPSRERISGILAEMEERAGIGPIINLPADKLFKIQVDLPVIADA